MHYNIWFTRRAYTSEVQLVDHHRVYVIRSKELFWGRIDASNPAQAQQVAVQFIGTPGPAGFTLQLGDVVDVREV